MVKALQNSYQICNIVINFEENVVYYYFMWSLYLVAALWFLSDCGPRDVKTQSYSKIFQLRSSEVIVGTV